MAVLSVEEHEPAWTVYGQSEKFVWKWKVEDMPGRQGPYLVDRVDGGLHRTGVVFASTGEWETDYRARIRGPMVLACRSRRVCERVAEE